MQFRLYLQPTTAIFFAIRDGIKDAHEGHPPYFWSLFSDPGNMRDRLRSGWKSIGKVFLFAIIIDAVYQIIELQWFYPGEALIVALILAIVPYLLLRGPVNRLVAARQHHRHQHT